jgi:hypothetical protein
MECFGHHLCLIAHMLFDEMSNLINQYIYIINYDMCSMQGYVDQFVVL